MSDIFREAAMANGGLVSTSYYRVRATHRFSSPLCLQRLVASDASSPIPTMANYK